MHRLVTVFILLSFCFLAATTSTQQRDATHGRDAEPDYDRVFAQDVVKRLDISVTAAERSSMGISIALLLCTTPTVRVPALMEVVVVQAF